MHNICCAAPFRESSPNSPALYSVRANVVEISMTDLANLLSAAGSRENTTGGAKRSFKPYAIESAIHHLHFGLNCRDTKELPGRVSNVVQGLIFITIIFIFCRSTHAKIDTETQLQKLRANHGKKYMLRDNTTNETRNECSQCDLPLFKKTP